MDNNLAGDLMVGASSIASFLGLPVRQVFYMAESGQLPLFKIGGKWAGRKSTITTHIARLEAATAEEQRMAKTGGDEET
jgi:hypothetical protein